MVGLSSPIWLIESIVCLLYGIIIDLTHPKPRHQHVPRLAPLDWTAVLQLANGELQRSEVAADWLRGVAAVVDAVSVIGQQRGGRGSRVSADDELQVVRRLGDQRNHEAAVEVPSPNVVNLENTERFRTVSHVLRGVGKVLNVLVQSESNIITKVSQR